MNQLEYDKIENILGNVKELDKLKKDSLIISGVKTKSEKWEKKIQDVIKTYFEHNLQIRILEEEFKDIKSLQEHSYILIPEFRKNIERLNTHLFSQYSHISQKIIVDKIIKDFVNNFNNSKDTVDRYELIFNNKTIELENKNGDKEQCYYIVLDLSNYKNNEITIIKEKKINDERLLKKCELPDFAYYVNGLPFIAIEIKTPETGTKAALKDYQNKISYQNFLSVIGTDGDRVFIGTNPKNEDIYYWANYGDNPSLGGFKDLSKELLFNIDNLLFYFQFSMLKVIANDSKSLKNARVQQYFVLKKYRKQFEVLVSIRENNEILYQIQKLEEDIKNNADKKDFIEAQRQKINNLKLNLKDKELKQITFKNHFKHHTRTGKSFTFKIILNYLTSKLPQLYSKIYIMTHDLTVRASLTKEFGVHQFKNLFGNIISIKDKTEYKKSVFDGNKGVYLLNMQKTELFENESVSYDNSEIKIKKKQLLTKYNKDDVLFIIDEVHTHQNTNDGYAAARNELFANASYITATATPSIIEKGGVLINMTKEFFGPEIDNFSPSDAVRLEIVVPLLYQKYLWEFDNSTDELSKIKGNLEHIQSRLEETSALKILGGKTQLPDGTELVYDGLLDKIIDELIVKPVIIKLFPVSTNIEEAIKEILAIDLGSCIVKNSYNSIITTRVKREFEELQTKKMLEIYRKQKDIIMYELSRHLIPLKLDIISDDVLFLKQQTKFKPKFFWIVEDIKTGLSVITHIKQITNTKNNVYKNLRFGLDVSSIVLDLIDSDDKEYLESNKIKIEAINGDYVVSSPDKKMKSDAICDFESDKDGSIDVLIIVGKYLMGYDLDKLLKVYLDAKIKDVKKIIQVATRASTKKQDKDKSFLLDLTLDDETKAVYEKALAIYDQKSDIDGFFIDQKTIDLELQKLDDSLIHVTKFMNERYEILEHKKDIITTKQDLVSHWYECVDTLVSEDIIDQRTQKTFGNNFYWKIIKDINKILKTLIAPKYYINSNKLDFSKYIESIMKINTIYFAKILYKENSETIEFSNEEIKDIIKDTFKLLSVDFGKQLEDINDIISIKSNSSNNIHEINSQTKVEIRSALYSLSSKLQSPPLPPGIANQLRKLIEEVEHNQNMIENWNTIQKITNEEFSKIIETIKLDYDNSLYYFIVSYNLMEYHKELIAKDIRWKSITKKMAKIFSNKIEGSISYLNDSQLKDYDEDTISIIIERLKLSNIDPYTKTLTADEIQLMLSSKYKINYIDLLDNNKNKQIEILFYSIIEEIFNKENIYEYFYKFDH